jgi:Rps23 Pro-64 3,4-dihydroxylase Tpa1-like proline 4-hydroxylase
MPCRSTILIDNFLSASDFNSISSRVAASEQYYDTNHHDMRDDLWSDVNNLVFERLREINLYQTHFEEASKIASFSYNQFRPPNYGHGNMYGPHIDNGSYVFYIHPDWSEDWEGKIKITDAVDSQYRDGIYAKPNRFIWMNPTVKHDISTTSSDAGHARVTNLGFLGGILHNDPSGVDYINIFTE